jgi:alpha-D-ribose 1-methylphosphonate 5-triphosphate diphosphatase PhnM
MSFLKPRDNAPSPRDFDSMKKYRHRLPDKEILEHDRKREVEVECFKLRDQLEEEEYVKTIVYCSSTRS